MKGVAIAAALEKIAKLRNECVAEDLIAEDLIAKNDVNKLFLTGVDFRYRGKLGNNQLAIAESTLWRQEYARACLIKWKKTIDSGKARKTFVENNIRDSGFSDDELLKAFEKLYVTMGDNFHLWDAYKQATDDAIEGEHTLAEIEQKQKEVVIKEILSIAAAMKMKSEKHWRVDGQNLTFAQPPVADGNNRPVGLSPNAELTKNVQFRQTMGANNCSIISTMNAMVMANEEMRERLSKIMTKSPENGGQYEFPNGITVTVGEVASYAQKNIAKFAELSEFEKVAFLAMNKYLASFGARALMPGQSMELLDAFGLFGLDVPEGLGGNKIMALTDAEMLIYAKHAYDELKADKVCVIRVPGHFLALNGVTFDGGVRFLVSESNGDAKSPHRQLDLAAMKNYMTNYEKMGGLDDGFQIYSVSVDPSRKA